MVRGDRQHARPLLHSHPLGTGCQDRPAKAIAAHAQDPQLAFIAGGTDLIGVMKDRFFFQAEDGIRDYKVTGVQTCALPISRAIGALLLTFSSAALLAQEPSAASATPA